MPGSATATSSEGDGTHDAPTLPVIAITMGDPAGIGPEIIAKALLRHEAIWEFCRPVVFGDFDRISRAASPDATTKIRAVQSVADAQFEPGCVEVLDFSNVAADLPYGEVSEQAGQAAYEYVERAVKAALDGEAAAICTAPLSKEALHAAGHLYPGHTELLAELAGVDEVSMMLVGPELRVIHVTTHIGLLDAIERIEPGLVLRTIQRGHRMLVDAGIERPRIAVCGINPHAGENGLFGRGEEQVKLAPAMARALDAGIDIEGPLPADTVFFRAGRGDFDLVVAMYHDQGHAPVKVLGLHGGVNVTVGLPFVRTSVDHGTAFDIAGTGRADERSLVEALRQAAVLSSRDRHERSP